MGTEGGSCPEGGGRDCVPVAVCANTAAKLGDFLVKPGDFLVKSGDFLAKSGDFLAKSGDFLVKSGDFLAKSGDYFPIATSDFSRQLR